MLKEHHYSAKITWTGNRGEGTLSYTGYDRSHTVSVKNKVDIDASSDGPFRGDVSKYNPEDLFLASLSSCHMLWYLHLCADKGIIVTEYYDDARGTMIQTEKGGHFTEVILHPHVHITDSDRVEEAKALHNAANQHCFIANSCKFPVLHQPVITASSA